MYEWLIAHAEQKRTEGKQDYSIHAQKDFSSICLRNYVWKDTAIISSRYTQFDFLFYAMDIIFN